MSSRCQWPVPGPALSGAELQLWCVVSDLEQPVVLRDPFTAGGGAGLELPAAGTDGQVGDEGSSVSPERWDTIAA